MQFMALTNEASESTDQRHQEKRMVEHLRGQLTLVKGFEMNMMAEMGNHDLEQKTEIQAYKLEINEKELRTQRLQYEARMMAEATTTLEDTANTLHVRLKEEQRQLREANPSLTEANKVLKRENLIGASSIGGKERMILEEIKELEKNLLNSGTDVLKLHRLLLPPQRMRRRYPGKRNPKECATMAEDQ